MSFTGFGPQALPFFKALGFHQTKEWFEANRAIYDNEIRGPFGDLVEDLAAALAKAGVQLKGDRKSSLFRIHRDVRFARNKSPYKTNAGAVLTRSGGKNDPGLLYFHLAPEGCFVAAGFYDPEPVELARLRAAIVRAPAAWSAMTAALGKAGLELSEEYAMKRAPRGFENVADPAIAAALRNKSFICSRPVPAERLAAPGLVADLAAFAGEAKPLLEWGWSAVVDTR
ncbi:MAG TPA: TIGR02453 family protein [Roseiarcus sp.]|jgi:uncharacterized protein (TIGR02453 family)